MKHGRDMGEPLVFHGNRTAEDVKRQKQEKEERGEWDPSRLSSLPHDSIDVRLRDEIQRQLDDEAETQLDRYWYDTDESGYYHQNVPDEYLEDEHACIEKELKLKRDLARIQERPVGIRETVWNAEQDHWEMNRMRRSGVMQEKELISGPALDDDKKAQHVILRDVKPPFLDDDKHKSTRKQQEEVCVVKDDTADMAVAAKRGSMALRQLRDKEDRTKMRKKFWQLAGTHIGKMVGVEEEEEEEEEEDPDRDYRQDSKYSGALKKSVATSDFAKQNSIAEQRKLLPVYEVRDDLIKLVRDNQVVVIIGETGSGKTTQLTQYLLDAGWGAHGMIGCTQPRRVAAVSVAKRVSEERNGELGDEIGYAIRFEVVGRSPKIRYMTDGVLLREVLVDPDLDMYSCIIMDEAHERSLNTDILFGILKNLLRNRRDFRLIVTSATMDADKFSTYFGGCPKFEIPGRTFRVDIHYGRSVADDYVDAAVQKCLEVHCFYPQGDILVFMTGQEDIEATCLLIAQRVDMLNDRGQNMPPMMILPIYSQLPADIQAKVFQPSVHRKVIVATNIAETSLTLDGIQHVIDSGYSKLKVFNPRIGMDSLKITPISQASAKQRMGRAGRTAHGHCHRLYTQSAYVSSMLESNIPEIQRTNLCNVVLLLKSLGVEDLLDFEFMDPPPAEIIISSMHQLWVLGALDNLGDITPLGRQLVQFPLDPPLAKMLITACELGCSKEVLTVVSMLSVPSIFFRPKDRADEASAAREKFFIPESDHLTLMYIYQQWERSRFSQGWCNDHFIHFKPMQRVREVRDQMEDLMRQQKLPISTCDMQWDPVRKSICTGYFHNAAKIRGIGEYINLRTNLTCHLHPNSALYASGQTPDYIVYHEVVLTTKEYMQNVTAVDAKWLVEVGPMFFSLKQAGGGDSQFRKEQDDVARIQSDFDSKIREDETRQKERNEKKEAKTSVQAVCEMGPRRKRK